MNNNVWDSGLELTMRNLFLSDLTRNVPAEKADPLIGIFLDIFDNCSQNESDFYNSISMYMDAANAPNEMRRMCSNALEYYREFKQHLASNVARELMFKEQLEAFKLPEEIKVEKKDLTKFTDRQREIIDEIIEKANCTVDYETLTNAVTLSCGHSFNKAVTLEIEKNLGNRVAPICHKCRGNVRSILVNNTLRKVAAKIESISNALNDQNSTFANQKELLDELNKLLICPYTKRLLSAAAIIPREDKILVCNEDAFMEKTIPVFELRELSRLVEKLNEPLEG